MKTIMKYKKYIILGVAVLLMLGLSILIYHKFDNDGMNNKKIYNVKYTVYQNGKWTKYSKNGITAGDKKNPIKNLGFKYNDEKGSIYYNAYTGDWSEQIYESMKDNSKNITGIQIGVSNILYKKYDICYRTYNNKDKWLNWTCDGNISGNDEEPITAVEVKIIPKHTVKFDYLKDFNETLEFNKNF